MSICNNVPQIVLLSKPSSALLRHTNFKHIITSAYTYTVYGLQYVSEVLAHPPITFDEMKIAE